MPTESCDKGKAGKKQQQKSPPLRIPLDFETAVEGLLKVKQNKKRRTTKKSSRKEK